MTNLLHIIDPFGGEKFRNPHWDTNKNFKFGIFHGIIEGRVVKWLSLKVMSESVAEIGASHAGLIVHKLLPHHVADKS